MLSSTRQVVLMKRTGGEALGLRISSIPATLTLPSPYSGVGPDMVHPATVYVEGGWHGYSYWMAITPYPLSDGEYENPCILASNDGTTWEVPAGVTNPLVESPASTGINSDPHLVLAPDSSKLYLLFRDFSGSEPSEHLKLMDSVDGVTWSSPATIYTSNSGTRRLLSPSLYYDGSQWVILAHDDIAAGNALQRMVNGSQDPYSGWPTAPAAVTFVHPDGTAWWHSFFAKRSDGVIFGLAQDTGSSSGALWQAQSRDNGQTFIVGPLGYLSGSAGGYYRSSYIIKPSGAIELFLGKLTSNWTVSRSLGAFDRSAEAARLVSRRLGLVASPGSALVDEFTRADNGSAIGTAPTGHTYTISAGSFGISSNRAYNPTSSNSRALTSLGAGGENCIVYFNMTVGTQGWVLFRALDSSNYWRLGWTSSVLTLQKIVAGSVTTNVTLTSRNITGIDMRVEAIGTTITIFWGADYLYHLSDTATSSHISVGLQASGATPTYFDYLMAEIA